MAEAPLGDKASSQREPCPRTLLWEEPPLSLEGFHRSPRYHQYRPSVTSVLESRRATGVQFSARSRLTLEELAQSNGVPLEGLEAHVKGEVSKFEQEMRTTSSYGGDKHNQLLDTLYNLFNLSSDDKSVAKAPWIKSCGAFDKFVAHFCPQANAHSKAYIGNYVSSFLNSSVHPQRHYEPLRGHEQRAIYEADGRWCALPGSANNWVEASVLDEVQTLVNHGYEPPDYTHGTASAALDGIGQQGAILSAREALRCNQAVLTGEYASYISKHGDVSVSGGRDGLGGIFVSPKGSDGSPSYAHVRWFDEYPVSFGIDRSRQEQTTKELNPRFKGSLNTSDISGEGITVGAVAPLGNVDYVYCWKKHQDAMKAWAAQHCPHARVVSFEAAKVLRTYRDDVRRLASETGASEPEAWALLSRAYAEADKP